MKIELMKIMTKRDSYLVVIYTYSLSMSNLSSPMLYIFRQSHVTIAVACNC